MSASIFSLLVSGMVKGTGSKTAHIVIDKLRDRLGEPLADRLLNAYAKAASEYSKLSEKELEEQLKLIAGDEYYQKMIYSFDVLTGEDASAYHKHNSMLFLNEFFKDSELTALVFNEKLDYFLKELLGLKANVKRLSELRAIIINAKDYNSLNKDIRELENDIEEASDPQRKAEKTKRLHEKNRELEDIIATVYQLYEQFETIPINTERLKQAKEYFDAGKFREADVVLNAKEIGEEVTQLKRKKEKAEKDIEDTNTRLINNSNELLMKAELQLTDFSNPDRFKQAIVFFKQALDAYITIEAFFQYAYFLHKQNQYKEAELLYQEALKIYSERVNKNPEAYLPYVAMTLNNLANLHFATNDFVSAEKEYQEALKIYSELAKKNPEAYLPDVATTLNNLANLHSVTNDFVSAEKEYQEALKIRSELAKKNPEPYLPDVARTRNNLANLHSATNDFVSAEKEYQEALKIYSELAKKNPEPYLPDVAMTLNNLAILHRDTNDFVSAEKEFQEALEISRELAKKNPEAYLPDVAGTLNNLGVLHRYTNDFVSAEKEYQEALKIYSELVNKNPEAYLPYVARTRNNLAILHSATNDFVSAEKEYQEALRIRR